jgi:hypothetical protein
MKVNVIGALTNEEIEEYIKRAEELHKGTHTLDIEVDGEYVELIYHIQPFERIRRITGYLVGDMGRWNDAKREEEKDRVKHSV